MMQILFSSWPRRLFTLVTCLVAFAMSLTLALMVGVTRSHTAAPAAAKIPVLGTMAVRLAEWRHGPLNGESDEVEEDVQTFRELRPLTAGEVTQLIQSLKDQRNVYLEQCEELAKNDKRLALYRLELDEERKQVEGIKNDIADQWDQLRKSRDEFKREVLSLDAVEARNLKQLASTYAAMKPNIAGSTVAKLDEDTAIKLLSLMRERSAAKILEQLDDEVAARLTERMITLKRTN